MADLGSNTWIKSNEMFTYKNWNLLSPLECPIKLFASIPTLICVKGLKSEFEVHSICVGGYLGG